MKFLQDTKETNVRATETGKEERKQGKEEIQLGLVLRENVLWIFEVEVKRRAVHDIGDIERKME